MGCIELTNGVIWVQKVLISGLERSSYRIECGWLNWFKQGVTVSVQRGEQIPVWVKQQFNYGILGVEDGIEHRLAED